MTKLASVALCATLLALGTTANAQENRISAKNEINIGYFNAFNLSSTRLARIGYRHHDEKGALRFMVGGDYSNSKSLATVDDATESNSSSALLETRVGYQRNRNIEAAERLMLYYGTDLLYTLNHSKRTNETATWDNNGNDAVLINENTTVSHSGGLRPIFGLRYQISKGLSLATETGFSVLFTTTENKATNSWSTTGDFSSAKSTQETLNVGNIGLGLVTLNFHF